MAGCQAELHFSKGTCRRPPISATIDFDAYWQIRQFCRKRLAGRRSRFNEKANPSSGQRTDSPNSNTEISLTKLDRPFHHTPCRSGVTCVSVDCMFYRCRGALWACTLATTNGRTFNEHDQLNTTGNWKTQMRVLLMMVGMFLASSLFGQDCVKNARGETVCGNGRTAAAANPNTRRDAAAHKNSNGVTTTQTNSGGKAKTKNGMRVAQGPNGKTCAKGKHEEGCTK
jgi:hypothetical protein